MWRGVRDPESRQSGGKEREKKRCDGKHRRRCGLESHASGTQSCFVPVAVVTTICSQTIHDTLRGGLLRRVSQCRVLQRFNRAARCMRLLTAPARLLRPRRPATASHLLWFGRCRETPHRHARCRAETAMKKKKKEVLYPVCGLIYHHGSMHTQAVPVKGTSSFFHLFLSANVSFFFPTFFTLVVQSFVWRFGVLRVGLFFFFRCRLAPPPHSPRRPWIRDDTHA